MTRITVTLIALMVMCTAVLAGDERTIDFDRSADFSKIKTFRIREGRVSTSNPEFNNPLYMSNLGAVVRAELIKKKLKETGTDPDVTVNYSLSGAEYSVSGPERGLSIPVALQGQRGIGGLRGNERGRDGPERYSEVTLVIEINKGTSSNLLWRGVYRDEESNASKLARKLPDDIRKLLSYYPPRK